MEVKKTHREQKQPQISLARLADYMAASEQAKRSIATSCKYQPIARILQYNDAKDILSNHLRSENREVEDLKGRLEILKNKICDNDFSLDVREHNCDCVSKFIDQYWDFDFKDYNYLKSTKLTKLVLNGMPVSVNVDVLVSRTNRNNKLMIGALMFRYSKGKPLSDHAAKHQSAFLYEYFRQPVYQKNATSEKKLCMTVDVHAAAIHEAPTNATYLFKEMAATCASLVERWPNIKPPNGAII